MDNLNIDPLILNVLITFGWALFFGICLAYGLVLYVGLKTKWVRLPLFWKLVFAAVWLFYPIDIVFNFIAGSALFREPPRYLTFSGRVKWHYEHDSKETWNYKIARPIWEFIILIDPEHLKG